MAATRARAPGGGGGLRAGLALLGLVLLGLTFAAGVLVGRQWARPASVTVAPEGPKKPPAAARRSGLVDTEAERPRDGQQKLTFYQTLTAPLGPPASYPTPPTASSDGKAKPSPAPPRERTTLAGASAAGGQGTEPTAPRSDDTPRAAAAPVSTGAANASWSVQVGVFGTRPQADVLERQLRGAGFEAYVSTLGAADGQTRYRVRVGPFRSRGEAERVAERVRSERSLPTYVATN